ncbi:hypothetical protein AKJ41_01265 [candidate division MSBL1 archaeon SCGC-AAA259O05]|uniref:Uncharacterized protein n=1 Tax=candidate division MSBL1 archaeon SCGC-AAA259O05 TaxID=1698271 RepID=A0A133V518_9EURY|nr:hypothetical protein AKJ41_01265 [candidate division MSBL1 archaeon SCGC-AAA259O05]
MPLGAIQNFYVDGLTEADRSKEFRCPIRGDEMIPVLPKEDVAVHFRHKNNEAHGEPETSQHIFGKRSVWRKAIDLGLESSLEARVGGNIADVVVEKVVVEVKRREGMGGEGEQREAGTLSGLSALLCPAGTQGLSLFPLSSPPFSFFSRFPFKSEFFLLLSLPPYRGCGALWGLQ